jgi:hypothetical protein
MTELIIEKDRMRKDNARREQERNDPRRELKLAHRFHPLMYHMGDSTATRAITTVSSILVLIAAIVAGALIITKGPGCACAGPASPPTGEFAKVEVIDQTSVTLEFSRMYPQQEPMKIEIVLEKNDVESEYWFVSNEDGELHLRRGSDIGTLTYEDMADNQIINAGDMLDITNLEPGSDFNVKMIWMPTGDEIASKAFSTPAGQADI